jgi:hypothetical protein
LQNRVTELEKENAALKEDLSKRGLDKRVSAENQGEEHFLKLP